MVKAKILIKDGDTILITAKTDGPTVVDPAHVVGGVGRAYRVVSHFNPQQSTFELIPIGEPYTISEFDIKRFEQED